MSKRTFFWIFLIIGICWITGVSILFINEVTEIQLDKVRWREILNSKESNTNTLFNIILKYITPLIITALLFYFIGLLFGKKTEEKAEKIEQENKTLKNELEQHVDKIETMKVLYTGGKIIRKTKDENKTHELKQNIIEQPQPIKLYDTEKDDLKVIEGIGERIEFFLNESGIYTWRQLADTTEEKLKDILFMYGSSSYKIHDPSTWAKQATLAYEKRWDELDELKEKIKKGS